MTSEEHRRLQPLSSSQLEMLEIATQSYQDAVTPVVMEWFEKERGLTEETVRGARAGVVADPAPGHERFRGWISIPYLDKDGHPLQIRFRCPKKHDHRALGHSKYATVAGDPARTYNIGAIHRAGDVISVTEGEGDTLVLTQLGLDAVAIPGVNNWGARHRRMFAGFSRVWVWGDGDPAGQAFNAKVLEQLRTARAVKMRNGHDVNSLFLAEGADAVLDLIK